MGWWNGDKMYPEFPIIRKYFPIQILGEKIVLCKSYEKVGGICLHFDIYRLHKVVSGYSVFWDAFFSCKWLVFLTLLDTRFLFVSEQITSI